jgi:aerobic carbon-monoxide dehydrogenase medium subunit
MLLRSVEYVRPGSVDEAIRLLGAHGNARALAGGQSLVNVMKLRVASPDVLVDLADLEELRQVEPTPDGGIELGPMVTYSQLMISTQVAERRPILAEVAGQIADVQVRNRGTLGGNVCSNDPTNHFPPLMVTMGATFTVRGAEGERTVPAEEFFQGVYMTAVAPEELLTKITIPSAAGGRDGFAAVAIGKDGTGIVTAAATLTGNGTVEAARIAIGCVAAVPVRATQMEEALAGHQATPERARAAVQGLGASLDPPGDVHASADYRRHLAEVLAVRAVVEASGEA